MKLAIMQPYLFPYIGYFQAINAVDKYLLYDNLNFIKEAWMNRNKFLVINGSPTFFIAELKEKSSFKKIYEIELIENYSWRKKILNSIFLNYKKAKYFNHIYPLFENVINYPTNKLTELNFQSIKHVCDYLNIKTKISRDSFKYNSIEIKLLNKNIDKKNFPDLDLIDWQRKVVRVLEICRIEKANVFINAVGGMGLYNKEVFSNNGIELFFVKTLDYNYKQQSMVFYPNLSIVDVLMNCGKAGTNNLINNYELI